VILTAANVRGGEGAECGGCAPPEEPLIRLQPQTPAGQPETRRFLYRTFYYHFAVGPQPAGVLLLKDVFNIYSSNPGTARRIASRRICKEALHRTVCDYLAGMTDRYLIEEHQRAGSPGTVDLTPRTPMNSDTSRVDREQAHAGQQPVGDCRGSWQLPCKLEMPETNF